MFTTLSPPTYYLVVPIDNLLICYATVDLSHENNMFNILGKNVENFVSLGYFRGYDVFLDPYCICLVDRPRKIMWNTFFDFTFEFFMTFSLLNRPLTFFVMFILMLSYYQAC